MYILLAGTLLVLCLVLVTFFIVLTLDIALVSKDLATSQRAVKNLSRALKDFGKENSVLYDLGSCRGGCLLGLVKILPGLKAYGIDNSSFRVRLSRFKAFLLNRPVIFLLGDMYKINLSSAEAVYIYQNQTTTDRLEKILDQSLSSGCLVITNTQHLSWPSKRIYITHPKKPEFEKIFVYVKD